MARRRKSKKGSLGGFAALLAICLLLGGNGENAAEVTPSPIPQATVTAFVTPRVTATPTDIPMLTATPTKRPDPTPAPDGLVWVSRSGSRYHCVADCSNMKNPIVMTEEEAIAKGRKPCGSCYK